MLCSHYLGLHFKATQCCVTVPPYRESNTLNTFKRRLCKNAPYLSNHLCPPGDCPRLRFDLIVRDTGVFIVFYCTVFLQCYAQSPLDTFLRNFLVEWEVANKLATSRCNGICETTRHNGHNGLLPAPTCCGLVTDLLRGNWVLAFTHCNCYTLGK